MNDPDAPLLFDDIRVGAVLSTEQAYEMTREEIVEVARRWDPQPFHMGDEAGVASHFGGLVASGLHTLAASMRLSYTERLRIAAIAGLGFDELVMLHPVRPGIDSSRRRRSSTSGRRAPAWKRGVSCRPGASSATRTACR